jgi:hypothetical protein
MDGIGGLVIGHIFKIPEELLPKGYKGETLGSKLGHLVNGIGHTINNAGDWVTKIDAQTIILDNPSGGELTFTDIVKEDDKYKEEVIIRKKAVEGGASKYKANITAAEIRKNFDEIERECIRQGITNKLMIIAIKANVLKETGGRPRNENLSGYANTSNERIRTIFTRRVASLSEDELTAVKKRTEEFAEYIYGTKSGKTGIGFGNNVYGDGYKYRGRSYIGITGKAQYAQYSKDLNKDFVRDPDSMNTPENAAATTVLYLKKTLPNMGKRMGINPDSPANQEQANLLVTSAIGGSPLTRPPKSAIFVEILNKVDSYAAQIKNQSNQA